MCPHLSANYVLGCPSNMAQVSVWAGNLQSVQSWFWKRKRNHLQSLPTGFRIRRERLLPEKRIKKSGSRNRIMWVWKAPINQKKCWKPAAGCFGKAIALIN